MDIDLPQVMFFTLIHGYKCGCLDSVYQIIWLFQCAWFAYCRRRDYLNILKKKSKLSLYSVQDIVEIVFDARNLDWLTKYIIVLFVQTGIAVIYYLIYNVSNQAYIRWWNAINLCTGMLGYLAFNYEAEYYKVKRKNELAAWWNDYLQRNLRLASERCAVLSSPPRDFKEIAKPFLTSLITPCEQDCVICYEKLHDPVYLKCKHEFCRDCILNWFGSSRKLRCPYCRDCIY